MSAAEDFLEHYGIRGMKWGVRRSPAQLAKARPDPATKSSGRPAWQSEPKRSDKPSGRSSSNSKPDLSPDAVVFRALREKAKAGGISSLSNDEIRVMTSRAEAVDKFNKTFPKPVSKKAKIANYLIEDLLIKQGKKTLEKIAEDQMKEFSRKNKLITDKGEDDRKKKAAAAAAAAASTNN